MGGALRGLGRANGRGLGFSRFSIVFLPSSLFTGGEVGAWYDPSDFSSMFQDSAGTVPVTTVGQVVGKINDKSGRGNHAIQATTASKPTLGQDGGGRYHLIVDGVDDAMQSASAIGLLTPNLQSVFGVTTSVGAGFRNLFSNGRYQIGCNTAMQHFTTTAVQTYNSNDPYFAAGVAVVANVLFDTGFDVTYRKNGAAFGAVVLGAANGAAGETGLNFVSTGGANVWDGKIYQAVLIGRALTAGEQTSLETFVNTKTGAY